MFSIVIPTKNEEDFLPIVLESVKRQTLQPKQIIVADAGSTDRTVEIARACGAVVVEGGVPSVGRNRGAAVADAGIIVFLDADVRIDDDTFFERGLAEFEKRHLSIATCDVHVYGGSRYDHLSHQLYNLYVRLWGKRHPHVPGFCIFVRKSLHQEIGGFDERVLFCEDQEYAARAARVGEFGILNDIFISVTTRRQERDGRLRMAVVYILAEIHMFFLGPITHDRFRYGFGYDKKTIHKTIQR